MMRFMFFIRDAIVKFGLSNTLSIISFFLSLTCFAFLARISQRYTKVDIKNSESKVIVANEEPIKISVKSEDIDSSSYDSMINDVDRFIENKVINNRTEEKKTEQAESKIRNTEDTIISKDSKAVIDVQDRPAVKNQATPVQNEKKAVIIEKKDIKNQVIEKKDTAPKLGTKIKIGIFKSHTEAVSAWYNLKNQNPDVFSAIRYSVLTNPSGTYSLVIDCKTKENTIKIKEKLKEIGIGSEAAA